MLALARCEEPAALAKTHLARPNHRPVTLCNRKFNGRWSGEIGTELTALVARDEVGKWSLTINRGRESCTFYPVTVSRPWELCFWLPAGWLSATVCEVFASAA